MVQKFKKHTLRLEKVQRNLSVKGQKPKVKYGVEAAQTQLHRGKMVCETLLKTMASEWFIVASTNAR